MAGCAGGGALEQIEADRSIVTGSIPAGPADPVKEADVATIRNAVTSLNFEQLDDAAVPWANSGTGSRGSIASVVEYHDDGMVCRRFTASRESFEGVMLYKGDACLRDGGFWWMRSFEAA